MRPRTPVDACFWAIVLGAVGLGLAFLASFVLIPLVFAFAWGGADGAPVSMEAAFLSLLALGGGLGALLGYRAVQIPRRCPTCRADWALVPSDGVRQLDPTTTQRRLTRRETRGSGPGMEESTIDVSQTLEHRTSERWHTCSACNAVHARATTQTTVIEETVTSRTPWQRRR